MDFFRLLIPFAEISIISVMIYYLLSFFWNTRAMDLVFGFMAFLFLYAFASVFQFPVLQKIMLNVINVVVIAILVIFQPELRLALSKISFKSKRYQKFSEFDKFLEDIAGTVYRLADRRTGAIILLENTDSLDEYANRAVILNAKFTPELLETIFMTSTPLHDGAVIIRENEIISAATILPLSDDHTQITKSMGTRHRAGLGISQISDALGIVISEEDGKVSIARDGIMTRGVKIDRFVGIVRSIFNPPQVTNKSKFSLSRFFKL